MANTVFFWPSDCAALILSPQHLPMSVPKANCKAQQTSEPTAMPIISVKGSLVCANERAVTAMAILSETAQM